MGGAGEAPPPPPPPPPPGEEAAEAAASTDEPPSNSKAAPYEWDPTQQVGTDVLQLWTEVGNGLEKSQTGTLLLAFCSGCGALVICAIVVLCCASGAIHELILEIKKKDTQLH